MVVLVIVFAAVARPLPGSSTDPAGLHRATEVAEIPHFLQELGARLGYRRDHHDVDQHSGGLHAVTPLIKGDLLNWGQIMTGTAPPLIIYAFLMDYCIPGLTAGAIEA
jgi:hypothetical protein